MRRPMALALHFKVVLPNGVREWRELWSHGSALPFEERGFAIGKAGQRLMAQQRVCGLGYGAPGCSPWVRHPQRPGEHCANP